MRVIGAILIVLFVVSGSVALVYGITRADQLIVQPITFNHAVHIDEAGLQCLDCHLNAATDICAGIPGRSICLDCHDRDDEEGSHEQKDKLFAYVDSQHDIPWIRVAVTRPDVFFSHRRHVRNAEIDCGACHIDQATLTEPPSTARLVMSMDACIACHEEQGASSDCLVCHR